MANPFDPCPALWAAHARQSSPWSCRARSASTALSWQRRVRPLLEQLLGFQDPQHQHQHQHPHAHRHQPATALQPRVVERIERSDHVRERHEITTATGVRMPVHLLLPTGPARVRALDGRRPAVIALCGHGAGAREIIGAWPDGSPRLEPDGYQSDFALALVRRGFVVAVPEIAGFGERQGDFSALVQAGSPTPTTCQQLAKLSWHLGGTVLGMRVRDTRRLIDYLGTLPQVDGQRIGAMGISGGGMLALFTAALEPRLAAVVVSGYFSTFRDSVLSISHCWCNFVPGLHQLGEMHELAGLVAPRPLLVESGIRDEIFPIAAVREGLAQAREHYALHGAQAALAEDLFDGRHRIHGGPAYRFLAEHLDPVQREPSSTSPPAPRRRRSASLGTRPGTRPRARTSSGS